MKQGGIQTSIWRDNLTINPKGRYMYGSVLIDIDEKVQIINRQSYSILDFLGDIGGLIDALKYIIALVLQPYWNFKYSSFLLVNVFRRPKKETKLGEFKAYLRSAEV